MALITDQPEDLKSSNDLDNVDDPDAPPIQERTEVYLSGAHVFTLEHAPHGLQRMTFMVDVEVFEAGGVRFTGENGETRTAFCKVRRIGDMYLPGTTRPPSKEEQRIAAAAEKARLAREKAEREAEEQAEQEENQPPMFTEDGDPLDPDAPPAGDDGDQGDDGDGNVVQFSDGGKK